MKNSKTQLDCLTISKELINCNIDWNTKAVLAYIQYRLRLTDIIWTFSQADISKTLNIPKANVCRLFKEFVTAGIFVFDRSELTRNKLQLKIYHVNPEALKNYMNSPEMEQFQNETVSNEANSSNLKPYSSKMKPLQFQNGTYKKDTIRRIEKKDVEESNILLSNKESGSVEPIASNSTSAINLSELDSPELDALERKIHSGGFDDVAFNSTSIGTPETETMKRSLGNTISMLGVSHGA